MFSSDSEAYALLQQAVPSGCRATQFQAAVNLDDPNRNSPEKVVERWQAYYDKYSLIGGATIVIDWEHVLSSDPNGQPILVDGRNIRGICAGDKFEGVGTVCFQFP